MPDEASSWSAYEKLVMNRLDTIDERLDRVETGLVLVRIDVAQLKVKAGLWGAAAGMLPALVTAVAAFAAGGLGGS